MPKKDFKQEDRVYIVRDIGIAGINVGDTATIHLIASGEYFYPVHLKLDKPCDDGHFYCRVDYPDIDHMPVNVAPVQPLFVQEPEVPDWLNVSGYEDIPL